MIREPGLISPTAILAFRLDSRDLARLILFWNRQGMTFKSRSEMIRATYELFIREHNIEEISYQRAGEILGEEFYRKTKRQEAVDIIVNRAEELQLREIQKRLDSSKEQSLDDVLKGVEEEES